jgi:hypothetical protein
MLFADSIKDKLPEDTMVHIVTNRPIGDEALGYLTDSIPVKNHIVYYNEEYPDLESRCRYMLNAFKIEPTNPWVIKVELDFLFLKHLSEFETILEDDLELVLEPEARKIFSDEEARRLWRIMYRTMEIKMPDFKIQFRENNETGLPLFGTGLICVRKELLPTINKRWESLTKMIEPWGPWNVHPNESSFTAMIQNEMWKWKIYSSDYKFNPISHFRDGPFPSRKLKDNCIIPDNVKILDYHHFEWLNHICKYNPHIKEIVDKSRQYIPDDVWNKSVDDNMSINKVGF